MSRFTTGRTSRRTALVAACVLCTGCASWQLPRIDPSGQRLFIWPGESPPVALAPPPGYAAPPVGYAAPLPVAPPPGSSNLQASPVYSDVPATPLAPANPPVVSTFANPFTPTVVGPPVAVVPVGQPPGVVAPVATVVPPPNAVPIGQDHVRITPDRVMAPIGSEVILKSGVCGADGYLHIDRRIEWLLARDGAGQFVDLGDRNQVDLFRWPWDTPRKIDNWYVIGSTAYAPQLINRGTPDPSDDIQVVRGETWISITSAVEGASQVTAVAPDVANWQFRQATATIYWIDAQWVFPPSASVEPGRPHVLTTTVTRRSDGAPLAGWIVRYDVPSGGASLGYASGDHTDATTDANGRASVEVSPNDVGGGTAAVGVTILRPAMVGPNATPQLEVGRGLSTINWGSGAAPTPINTQPQLSPTPITPTPASPTPISPIPTSPPPGSSPSGASPYTSPPSAAPFGAPRLEVRLSNPAPATVAVGEYVSFDLTVINRGNAPARNILIYDRFDQGFSHAGDQSNRHAIENRTMSDLSPNESATLPLTFRVLSAGTICHEATVSAEGATSATQRGCVTVQQANVQVKIETLRQQLVNANTEYRITVQNVGSVPASNVELIQSFTNVLRAAPTSAEQTLGQDGSIHIAIPSMNAGEVRSFRTQALCLSPSAQACSRATVTIGGNAASQADACLEIVQQVP